MAFFEFPHTRTYDSDLAWLIHAYKLLKAQADDIQDSIQQIVDDTLNDPTYVARVLAVLAPLNVKYPPSDAGLTAAKGDGVTDDTEAITGMIAYAYEHNMPLLFPSGQYVVSGLTVSNDITFIGLGGTLFLKAGAVNPLITVKGCYLTATGIDFNGNIAGQTDPKNVIVVNGGGFKLDNCTITGGVDGIHANIDTPSFITGVDIDNFTEYGIYVEGSSFINANGVTMNVASGGALRLMRVDASNCVFNGIESTAEVAIAFEVTGDFNYFLARVPNAETPTSDSGQNNNFEIIAQLSKRTYQNLIEKVDGDYTQEVGDFEGTANGHYTISAPDVVLNPENPLTYKTPTELSENNGKGYIPMKDEAGNIYYLPTFILNMIQNVGSRNYKSIFDYGAFGDGVHDDTQAFIAAVSDNDCNTTFIPSGFRYVLHGDIPENVNHLFLTDGPLDTSGFSGTLGEIIPQEPGLRAIDTMADTWSGERKTYFFRATEEGTKGFTKHGVWYQGINQSESSNFCWTMLVTMDSQKQNESDDVALYIQTNGVEGVDNSMWGIALENNERSTTNPTRSKIGIEVLLRAHGDDSNKMRHGIHITMIPHANTVGARFASCILLSGGDTGTSPGYITSCMMLDTITADALISIRDSGDVVKLGRGIDFTHMQIEKAAILLSSDKILQFQNFSLRESGGQLHLLRGGDQNIDSGSIYSDSSDMMHLKMGVVDITMNPEDIQGVSGVTIGLPVNVNGTDYLLPLYPKN